jgi:Lrp/AsnC family transcriptional regulator for asnA, asnC and gidA
MQPDETDWKIISLLSKAHQPNNKIADQLGLSEATVRRRIKSMQSAGILKIKALLNPEILENRQLAVVTVNLEKPKLLKQKAKEIAKLDNVASVSIISGRYDLMIEVIVESNKGLVNFVTESLSTVEEIGRTETFVVMKSYDKFI